MTETVIRTAAFSDRCQHNRFIVDTSLSTVTCGTCEKELNPMWVLEQLAGKESRAKIHLDAIQAKVASAKAKLRCKCEHCQKMTRIQR